MDKQAFRVLIIDDDISFELSPDDKRPRDHGRFADVLSALEREHPEIEVYGMRCLPGRSGRVLDEDCGAPAVRLLTGVSHADLAWTDCDAIVCDLKFRADDAHSPYTAEYPHPPDDLVGVNTQVLSAHWDTLLERAQGCVFLFHALARKQLRPDTLFALLTANDEDPVVDAVLDNILSPDAGLDISPPTSDWPWTLKFGKTPSHNSASHNRSGIQQLVVALRCKFRAWQANEVLDGRLMNNLLLYGSVSESQLLLILGESGTGKERVARELTLLWRERYGKGVTDMEFIPVNCANLRREFAQSELFGHVRGAYTGAESARAGVFLDAALGTRLTIPGGKSPQAAFVAALRNYLIEDEDNMLRLDPQRVRPGVLFLDEIGDLPQDVQEMLLRALAGDGEIEPLGLGRRIRGVRPRVIAATSDPEVARLCDYALASESRGKPQRGDLYRRFAELGNIIRVPPFNSQNLRPRVESLLRRRSIRWGTSACNALVEHLSGLLAVHNAGRPFGQWRDVLSLVKEIELRWRDAEAIGLRYSHAGRLEIQGSDVERYVRSRRSSVPPLPRTDSPKKESPNEAPQDPSIRSFFAGLEPARQEFARGVQAALPGSALPANWEFSDLVGLLEQVQAPDERLRIRRTFRDTLRRYLDDAPDFVGPVFKLQVALGSGTALTTMIKKRERAEKPDIAWFFEPLPKEW